VRIHLGQLRRPDSLIGTFGLMYCEVGGPDSVVDHSLSEVPFLEIIASVCLMSRMDFRGEDHFSHEFSLLETLINQQVVFLMHSSVTSLAGSLEDLESSPQSIKFG